LGGRRGNKKRGRRGRRRGGKEKNKRERGRRGGRRWKRERNEEGRGRREEEGGRYLFPVVKEVHRELRLLHVVGLHVTSKKSGQLFLVRVELHLLPVIFHLDPVGFVLRRKDDSVVSEGSPFPIFLLADFPGKIVGLPPALVVIIAFLLLRSLGGFFVLVVLVLTFFCGSSLRGLFLCGSLFGWCCFLARRTFFRGGFFDRRFFRGGLLFGRRVFVVVAVVLGG
jgi:hypothetical protein